MRDLKPVEEKNEDCRKKPRHDSLRPRKPSTEFPPSCLPHKAALRSLRSFAAISPFKLLPEMPIVLSRAQSKQREECRKKPTLSSVSEATSNFGAFHPKSRRLTLNHSESHPLKGYRGAPPESGRPPNSVQPLSAFPFRAPRSEFRVYPTYSRLKKSIPSHSPSHYPAPPWNCRR
jgi:hypothetical protein